jgi:hypothetical protein
MQSLFEIATTEGWVDMMYKGVDAVGQMRAPRRDNNESWALFYVAFIIVGCFFVLNLCVGVIIDNYNKMKLEGQAVIMTPPQQQWVASQRALFRRRLFYPLTNLHQLPESSRRLYLFVTSSYFENSIMGCICLNTLTMAMATTPPPHADYQKALDYLNYIFAGVFNVEAVLKLAAMRSRYFTENWNLFDFICVVATNISIIINEFTNIQLGTVVSAIRIFRIARLLRLLRFLKGLNQLFTAFMLSIPKLVNVGAILCLLIYLYAVLGMNLFAKVKSFDLHGPYANFRTFYRSMMTLVRSFTGEAWNDLMHDLARDRFFFDSILGEPCVDSMEITVENYAELKAMGRIDDPIECGSVLSYPFFLTYTMLVTFVVLNLFIAVIIEGFNDSQNAMEEDHIALCLETWKGYDPDFTLTMELDTALLFISSVYCTISQRQPIFVPGLDENGMPRGRTRGKDGEFSIEGLSLGKCPMKYAKALDLKISQDFKVHLTWAIAAVLRLVVSTSDYDAARSIETLEIRGDEFPELVKVRALEKKHLSSVLSPVCQGETQEFKQLVAICRIQHQVREKIEWKRKVAEITAEVKATGHAKMQRAAKGISMARALSLSTVPEAQLPQTDAKKQLIPEKKSDDERKESQKRREIREERKRLSQQFKRSSSTVGSTGSTQGSPVGSSPLGRRSKREGSKEGMNSMLSGYDGGQEKLEPMTRQVTFSADADKDRSNSYDSSDHSAQEEAEDMLSGFEAAGDATIEAPPPPSVVCAAPKKWGSARNVQSASTGMVVQECSSWKRPKSPDLHFFTAEVSR